MNLPTNIQNLIATALPVDPGNYNNSIEAYDGGYRDAMESIAMALTGTIPEGLLLDAVNAALDAFANNCADGDFEDDGQPSEQQEWRDYDPDC
jgi:hypothetical protein